MTDIAAASALMRELAPAGSAKERIGVAVSRVNKLKHITRKWSWSRAKDIWYGDARRIDAHEMDALRAAIRKREIEEERREFAQLRARIERLEAALAMAHPTLDRGEIDMVQQAMRGPRRMGGAGTERDA